MGRKYFKLKGCPKCGGDLLIDRAYEEAGEVCIQCGYRKFTDFMPETAIEKAEEKLAVVSRK